MYKQIITTDKSLVYLVLAITFLMLTSYRLTNVTVIISGEYPMSEPNVLEHLLFYILFVGLFQIILFLCVALILRVFIQESEKFRSLAKSILQFNIMLLIFGSLFNAIWNWQIAGHLYDNWDVLLDYTPFWIVQREILNPSHSLLPQSGLAEGIMFWHLQLIWTVFTIATWLLSYLGLRLLPIDFELRYKLWQMA